MRMEIDKRPCCGYNVATDTEDNRHVNRGGDESGGYERKEFV